MTSRFKACTLAVVCALVAGIAQQLGSISGLVTDPTGAPVAKVAVALSDVKTGLSKNTQTDDIGRYRFSGLPPGDYQISFESPGFKRAMQTVTVGNSPVQASIQLQIGDVAESITVSATASSINTSTAMAGGRYQIRAVAATGIRRPSGAFNTEEYGSFVENAFADARRNPLSTFSADVDTASYSNVRRYLLSGAPPPPEAVRIEELINYFPYNYSAPLPGQAFSATTGVMVCPWKPEHKLVHIGLRTPSVDTSKMPPANLVFLIDVSGSMQGPNRLGLVQRSLQMLVAELREQDRVGIVVYAGSAGVVLPPTAGSEKGRISAAIEDLKAGGSTHGSAGIRGAYQLARESFLQNGNNRVILATDGDFNVGESSDAALVRLIESERESGVFLTVLGYGMDNLKDSKMEKLAAHGNGNYAYIDSISEARKVLIEQMAGTLLTVAKDVKFQVEFNPARVKSYRLIGYENRILRPEEFNDDKKDAGNAGAGMTVTAIYEVIPHGAQDPRDNVDPLRYQGSAPAARASRSNELAMLKVRYKNPRESASKLFAQPVIDSPHIFTEAPPELKFAAAVAEFGLLVRQSKYAGAASYDHVLAVAESTRGKDPGGYRAEFAELVRTARSRMIASAR